MSTRYTLCVDAPTVACAARTLARSPVLLVDCEGRNIGGADGVLSLVCIGTANAEHIFVLDVLALSARTPALAPVLALLADPALKKIMWDCRNDFLEIAATYGVSLQGVLDLQLAEIDARTAVRGERGWKRIARLSGRRLPMPLVKQNPDLFAGVHSLQGMDACLRDARLVTTGKDRKSPGLSPAPRPTPLQHRWSRCTRRTARPCGRNGRSSPNSSSTPPTTSK
jgi:exonuclease 3'-5' domain-containing protein 1